MRKKFAICTILLGSVVFYGCAKNTSSDTPEDIGDLSADTASIQDEMPSEDSYVENDPDNLKSETASNEMAYAPGPSSKSVELGEGTENYTVQSGDTLMKIAFNVYGDIDMWRQVYEMNRDIIKNPKVLRVGLVIKYNKPVSPPSISQVGEPYLIKTGDTLGRISYEIYATHKKWRKLYENNRELIKDPNRIYAGFYLYYQITEEEKKWAESHRSGVASGSIKNLPRGTASVPLPAGDQPIQPEVTVSSAAQSKTESPEGKASTAPSVVEAQ